MYRFPRGIVLLVGVKELSACRGSECYLYRIHKRFSGRGAQHRRDREVRPPVRPALEPPAEVQPLYPEGGEPGRGLPTNSQRGVPRNSLAIRSTRSQDIYFSCTPKLTTRPYHHNNKTEFEVEGKGGGVWLGLTSKTLENPEGRKVIEADHTIHGITYGW